MLLSETGPEAVTASPYCVFHKCHCVCMEETLERDSYKGLFQWDYVAGQAEMKERGLDSKPHEMGT